MAKNNIDQDTSLVTARTPLEAYPVGSLFFTHGERFGQEIPLARDTFFVGRSKNNNLYFDDKSVSRKHAVINMLDGKYIISDLNSLKGTYVNGKKIEEVTLNQGDVINIGENRMQFRLITPSGRWISPGRNSFLKYLLIFFFLVILGGGGYWFYNTYTSKKLPAEVMSQIVSHYDKGVELYNKEHDLTGARGEWQKILELDPELKTQFGARAQKLLKNTESEKPSE